MFDLCTIVALLWYTSKAQYKSLINNNNNNNEISFNFYELFQNLIGRNVGATC